MNRHEALDQAGQLIDGPRADDYGLVKESFQRIAAGWSEITKTEITPIQVGMMMQWLKICRLTTSPRHADSHLDVIGYAALTAEVADLEDDGHYTAYPPLGDTPINGGKY